MKEKVNKLIIDINKFIGKNHSIDSETIMFLGDLKENIMTLTDGEPKRKISQPVEKTLLRAVGARCIVDCYKWFQLDYEGEDVNLVKKMFDCGGAVEETSARTKASAGRKIFKTNLTKEVLLLIVNSKSKRITKETREAAKTLLSAL